MKLGRSLQSLAEEIDRQSQMKKDFIANTSKVSMFVEGPDAITPKANVLVEVGDEEFGINDLGHAQIGGFANIPRAYYDRMRESEPDLLAYNVNTWLHKAATPRLVRVLDDKVRAFLSDAYRPLENWDLAQAILPTLLDQNLEIVSCEITEKKLYIKAVDSRISRDIPTGHKLGDGTHTIFDTLVPALTVSNSEVGWGRLLVETGTLTKGCTNLAFWSDGGMKKTHLGKRHELLEGVSNIDHLLTSEAKAAGDKAVWLQVRDVVKGAFDEALFDARVKKLSGAVEDRIEGDLVKLVELSAKKFGLSELISRSVQKNLIEGADLTRYGLFNAVTRAAQDVESYDEASDLERLGGKIIELGRSEWRELDRLAA